MSEKELKSALDGVVEDAVAVVGADLNVASETLLRSVLARLFVFICVVHFSSSRMRVIYHNWSATKQRPHPLSVAEISRHSVL